MKTAATGALAAGAILLSAGCTSKKDVAISAKDDTIRRQEAQIRDDQAARVAAEQRANQAAEQQRVAAEEARRAADLNKQLADQNTQALDRNAQLTKASIDQQNAEAARIAAMQAQMIALNESVSKLARPAPNSVPGSEISQGKDGSIHIRVAGSVLFDPGRAELRGAASETLLKAAKTIREQYPNNAIRIEGHTDSTPVVHSKDRYPDNMALSQARAAAVYDFMLKRGGISSNRMYTAGYGDRQPLVQERTAADRARNRRVEIVILPNNLNVRKDQLAQGGASGKVHVASKNTGVVAASATAPAEQK